MIHDPSRCWGNKIIEVIICRGMGRLMLLGGWWGGGGGGGGPGGSDLQADMSDVLLLCMSVHGDNQAHRLGGMPRLKLGIPRKYKQYFFIF